LAHIHYRKIATRIKVGPYVLHLRGQRSRFRPSRRTLHVENGVVCCASQQPVNDEHVAER